MCVQHYGELDLVEFACGQGLPLQTAATRGSLNQRIDAPNAMLGETACLPGETACHSTAQAAT